MDEKLTNRIYVAARIRPLNEKEKGCIDTPLAWSCNINKNKIVLLDKNQYNGEEACFTFDSILWTESTTKDVYDSACATLVDSLTTGRDSSLITYGFTGSGMSYSLYGNGPDGGVVHLLVDELMKQEVFSPSFSLSFIEVYQENVYDLYQSRVSLSIRESIDRGFYVESKRLNFCNLSEFSKIVSRGLQSCHTVQKDNSRLGRSHTLLSIYATNKNGATNVLRIIDLAGAQHTTGTSGVFLDESRKLNLGLSSIYRVFKARTSGDLASLYSGFRDTRLARLLQPVLDGFSNTRMLFCMSPAATCVRETISSIRFASMARGVWIRSSTDPVSAMSPYPRSSVDSYTSHTDRSDSLQEKRVLEMALEWIEMRKAKDYALTALVEELKSQLDEVTRERDQLIKQNEALESQIVSLQSELSTGRYEEVICRSITEQTTKLITTMENLFVHSSV